MIIRKLVLFGIMALLALAGCEKDNPVSTEKTPFVISTKIDSAWNISGNEKYLVEVKADDPQGVSDLKTAQLTIIDSQENIIFQDSLFDDGGAQSSGSGDLIANDGVFRNQYQATQITSNPGLYYFQIVVEDKEGNQSVIAGDTVEFSLSSPLLLTSAWSPDSLLARDKKFTFAAEVRDTANTGAVINAWFDLTPHNGTQLLKRYALYNDGDVENHDDYVAGDSLFSSIEDTSFGAGRLGWYDLKFQAQNEFGSVSNVIIRPVYIENKAGVIYNTDIPDTLKIPQTGTKNLKIRAWVTDPQSNLDVDSVYCRIQDKLGNFLSNNFKFILNDLGQNGDDFINDGIYTLVLSINSENNPDNYTFYFNMRDKAGNLSNTRLDYTVFVK